MVPADADRPAEDRFGDRWQDGFWAAVDQDRIALQFCENRHVQFPGGPLCSTCGGTVTWETVSGEGEVWSWAVFHREYFPEFSSRLPYSVLIVALNEGPWIYTGLHPDEPDWPEIGDRIRLEIADYPLRPVPLARRAARGQG